MANMVNVRPLPPVLQKAAIEQLNEVPERVADDIEALRTWVEQQPHLRARTDDQFLLGFLRGCKFSMEKAKSKLDKYYTLKTKFPELFTCTDVDDTKVRELIRLGLGVYLPIPLNENGPRLAIFRNGIYPPDKFQWDDLMRVMAAVNEIVLLEDDVGMVNGFILIMDLSGMTAQHFLMMKPSTMKKMTVYSEEAWPIRPKAQHFINTPSGFETIFNTFKPLMPAKQLSRMFVHGTKMELLYEHIPQKYLPKEYGGENGSVDEIVKDWEQKILSYREFFKENEKYGTDEFLRPGKPIDFESMFGMEGSFRKLNVD